MIRGLLLIEHSKMGLKEGNFLNSFLKIGFDCLKKINFLELALFISFKAVESRVGWAQPTFSFQRKALAPISVHKSKKPSQTPKSVRVKRKPSVVWVFRIWLPGRDCLVHPWTRPFGPSARSARKKSNFAILQNCRTRSVFGRGFELLTTTNKIKRGVG